MLLTFLTGGSAVGKENQVIHEDISTAALECLASLFGTPTSSAFINGESLDRDAVLVLGQVVTVILDRLTNGPSNRVQEVAANAIGRVVGFVSDSAALRSFLPGIISSITKVLHPTTRSPRSSKVLEGALGVVSQLLQRTCATSTLGKVFCKTNEAQDAIQQTELEPEQAWMKATSAQIKLALASIVQLRYHEKQPVVGALFHLCIVVLRDCRVALPEAASIMLETSVIICGHSDEDIKGTRIRAIQDLISCDSSIVDMLKIAMHDWVSALPRVMQSSATVTHYRQISLIAAAYHIAENLDIDLDMLDLVTGKSLYEGISTAINIVPSKSIQPLRGEHFDNFAITPSVSGYELEKAFVPLSLGGSSQTKVLQGIQDFVRNLVSTRVSKNIRRQLLRSLTATSGSEQLACLWLCSRFILGELLLWKELDVVLNCAQQPAEFEEEFVDVVYSFCINLLSTSALEDESTWLMQALALEVLAFRSCQQKQDFRPELVDALYPVVERLGSSNLSLREHAITSLNIITIACNYRSSSDLIIQNIDYLVNSVALKLNIFDIGPETPHVLVMMVKLCGARLIPYLDDLIESVFSALASFHGYPRLVESLCAVLHAIVDESKKVDDALWIEDSAHAHIRKASYHPSSVAEVAEYLKQQFKWRPSSQNTFADGVASTEEKSASAYDKNDDDPEPLQPSNAVAGTPQSPSKTYTTVQSIVRIGEHYLTHESPKLRRQVLQLMGTGCVTLSRNEDEFFPLINDIWPVVVKRLYDEETFVSVAACETISDILKYAGDFVAARMDNEWPGIRSLYQRAHAKMLTGNQVDIGQGRFSASYQMWNALIKLCCRLIEFIRIEAQVEDDLMDILMPYIKSRSDVRAALYAMNPDAVWLEVETQKQKSSSAMTWETPVTRGFNFMEPRF